MENFATHKAKPVLDWPAKRKRWHVHFTPTAAPWINQIERFFANLTEKQIRRGMHRSSVRLEADILAAIQRLCFRTQQIGRVTGSGHWAVSNKFHQHAHARAFTFDSA